MISIEELAKRNRNHMTAGIIAKDSDTNHVVELMLQCTIAVCERLDLISAKLDNATIQILPNPECKIEVEIAERTTNASCDEEEESGQQE